MTIHHDVEIMERLERAVKGGEVTTEAEFRALCRNVQATHGHVFSVLLMLRNRLPWDRGEAGEVSQ